MEIALRVDPRKVAAEKKAAGEPRAVEAGLSEVCAKLIAQLQDIDCKSLIVCTSEWVQRQVDARALATRAGLLVSEQDYRTVFPQSLFAKPVLCSQDFLCSISKYMSKVNGSLSNMCVFPSFMDCDFAFPKILIKVCNCTCIC